MSKKKDTIPLSINFRKLQLYNFDYFSLEEIVLFELFIVLSIAFGNKPFYHSSTMIRSETGIKRTKQETIIKKFLEKGILSNVEVKGNPPIKYIRLNFRWIYENLGKFCIMSEKQDFNNMRVDYFKALVEINKIFVDTNEQEII